MAGNHDYRLEKVEQHGDRVVVSISWAGTSGERHRWAQVHRLRDGRIVDMQDHKRPVGAVALTRLRALLG